MTKRAKEIVDLLMRRDGMTEEDAFVRYKEVKSELMDAIDGTSCIDPEEVLMDELGIEPDYIFNFI